MRRPLVLVVLNTRTPPRFLGTCAVVSSHPRLNAIGASGWVALSAIPIASPDADIAFHAPLRR